LDVDLATYTDLKEIPSWLAGDTVLGFAATVCALTFDYDHQHKKL
jgi:hypothetical protein